MNIDSLVLYRSFQYEDLLRRLCTIFRGEAEGRISTAPPDFYAAAHELVDLAGTYGFRPQVYTAVCRAMGAEHIKASGECWQFEFLPGLFVRFTLWEGDEEFAATSQIVFSDNFPDAFAAEDRVVVCEYILGEMKRVGASL